MIFLCLVLERPFLVPGFDSGRLSSTKFFLLVHSKPTERDGPLVRAVGLFAHKSKGRNPQKRLRVPFFICSKGFWSSMSHLLRVANFDHIRLASLC